MLSLSALVCVNTITWHKISKNDTSIRGGTRNETFLKGETEAIFYYVLSMEILRVAEHMNHVFIMTLAVHERFI